MGVNLDVGEFEYLNIKGNKLLLSVMLTNLLDNSIKYTPSGKNVKVLILNKKLIIED